MRISELSERSGIPVATVKYYLREGLLHAGEMVNARQASYDETHVRRLRLIRGLVHALGNSIEQVRQILEIVDGHDGSVLDAMAEATATISSCGNTEQEAEAEDQRPSPAQELLDDAGFEYEPTSSELRKLDAALALADEAGIRVEPAHLRVYVEAARSIARADFERIPWDDQQSAVQFAVLGTALYEPVLLALRRLAHYEQGVMRAEQHPEN